MDVEWQPIDTAPKDELIDVWCVYPEDSDFQGEGVRFTDVSWFEADGIFPYTGWTITLTNGNFHNLEHGYTRGRRTGYPPWFPKYWMPCPEPPK